MLLRLAAAQRRYAFGLAGAAFGNRRTFHLLLRLAAAQSCLRHSAFGLAGAAFGNRRTFHVLLRLAAAQRRYAFGLAGAAFGNRRTFHLPIFGLVFIAIRHRMAVPNDFLRSLALAGCAFAAVGLIPGLKYPATPPGVGDRDTVGQRTALYLILLAYGIVVVVAAWRWARALRERGTSQPARVTLIGVAVVGVVGLAYAVLPASPDAIPADVPADVVWRFRITSLAGLAVVWGTIGLVFGLLCTVPRLRRRPMRGLRARVP